MNALELVHYQLELSKNLTAKLLADMVDAPLTAPTPAGGNHPTWVAGHLAYAEANLVYHILEDQTNPLVDWKELFGRGSEPSDDADLYPPLPELLAKWDEVRKHTSEYLGTLTEADLDKTSANPPSGREDVFGTVGKVLSMIAMHPLMHRGSSGRCPPRSSTRCVDRIMDRCTKSV